MPIFGTDNTITIKGTYPNAQYFSFVVYDTNADGSVTGAAGPSLYDAEITPDSGTNNPFVNPGGGNGTYTVVVQRGAQPSGNTMGFTSAFAWVMLRIYEPHADPSLGGQSLTGGVPLPTITVDGTPLDECSPVNKLPDVFATLNLVFPPGVDIIGTEGTPYSNRLWFAPPTVPPTVMMPNADDKYICTLPGDAYEPGRIIVIHGKAPTTPATLHGARARGSRTPDVRYWSLCENDLALPVPSVACTADITTKLNGGYYTIVISDDVLRPHWLRSRPNVTWLPWGDEDYPKLLFFRNMLPASNFPYSVQTAIDKGCTFPFDFPNLPDSRDAMDEAGQCAQGVMGDYYPVAAWCNKSTFIHGGWKACLK